MRGHRCPVLSRECRVRCQACQLRARKRSLRTHQAPSAQLVGAMCAASGYRMRVHRVPDAHAQVPDARARAPSVRAWAPGARTRAFTLSVQNSPAAQPLASGPARVIVILTITRRSRRMAAR